MHNGRLRAAAYTPLWTPAAIRHLRRGTPRTLLRLYSLPVRSRRGQAAVRPPLRQKSGSGGTASSDKSVPRPQAEWVLTTRAACPMESSSRDGNMYADAVAKISESIFPIFYIQHEDNLVGVCGTGFFVDDGGLFVTSDHVMASPPQGSTVYFYGKTPDEVCEPAVEIEHVWSDPSQDLYLGRVARDYLPPAELSNDPVRPGDSVCLSGYPLADLEISPQGGLVGSVRRYWQPTFVDRRDRSRDPGQDIRWLHRRARMLSRHEWRTSVRHGGKGTRLGGCKSHRTIPPLPDEASNGRGKRHRD